MNATPHWREAGEGPRGVVLLHGIGGDAGLWAPTMPALAALPGHRVLAWDMPGYGASPPLDTVTFPALAAALAGMLEAAGLTRADLVGHSIGGMVALEFAATWPERVRSLVLYGSPAAFGGRDPAFRERFLAARLAPLEAGRGMAGIAPEVVAGLLGERPDPEAAPAAIAAMSAVPETSYRAILGCLTGFDRRAALPHLGCPVLLLAGEQDPNAPFPTLFAMSQEIPRVELALLAHAGHLAHLEQPGPFNERLQDFLAEVAEA
jgi:3-oxoadipate enol-lactonase